MNSGLTSHQQRGHTAERPEKRGGGVDLANPGQHNNEHYVITGKMSENRLF